MAFRISEINNALRTGVASPTSYEVQIFTRHAFLGIDGRDFSAMCCNAQLPGRAFQTTPHFIFGVAHKMPYAVQYNDLYLTFVCDQAMRPRKFIDQWQSFIQNPSGNYFQYYDNYVADIDIYLLNKFDVATYLCRIEEAYPVATIAQELSYGDTDNYLRFTVQFAYKKWKNALDLKNAQDSLIVDRTNGAGGTALPQDGIGPAPGFGNTPSPFDLGAPGENSPAYRLPTIGGAEIVPGVTLGDIGGFFKKLLIG